MKRTEKGEDNMFDFAGPKKRKLEVIYLYRKKTGINWRLGKSEIQLHGKEKRRNQLRQIFGGEKNRRW